VQVERVVYDMQMFRMHLIKHCNTPFLSIPLRGFPFSPMFRTLPSPRAGTLLPLSTRTSSANELGYLPGFPVWRGGGSKLTFAKEATLLFDLSLPGG
jgi:hypothetical protein